MDVALNAISNTTISVGRLLLDDDPKDQDSSAADVTRDDEPSMARSVAQERLDGSGQPPGRGHDGPPPGTIREVSTSERTSFELSATRLETTVGASSGPARAATPQSEQELPQFDSDGDGRLTPADVVWPRLKLFGGLSESSLQAAAGTARGTDQADTRVAGQVLAPDRGGAAEPVTVALSDGRTTDVTDAWLDGVV